jgi:hypothetical protein
MSVAAELTGSAVLGVKAKEHGNISTESTQV